MSWASRGLNRSTGSHLGEPRRFALERAHHSRHAEARLAGHNPDGHGLGDNLFTNSVVLDPNTGALKWWFQSAPNGVFDYDMSAAPRLYTVADGGARVAIAGQDGHLFGVNRAFHKPLDRCRRCTSSSAQVATAHGVKAAATDPR